MHQTICMSTAAHTHPPLIQFSHFREVKQYLLNSWIPYVLATHSPKGQQTSNTFDFNFQKTLFSTVAKSSLILTPTSFLANDLKKAVLTHRKTLIGFQFYTPGIARTHLKNIFSSETQIATPEELYLLTHIAAQSLKSSTTLEACIKDPKRFVKGFDALAQLGINTEEESESEHTLFEDPIYSNLSSQLKDLLERCKLDTIQSLDRNLIIAAQKTSKQWEHVFICGFNAEHWNYVHLLLSIIASAEKVTFCSTLEQSTEADQLWIGSWENMLGASLHYSNADPLLPSEGNASHTSITQSTLCSNPYAQLAELLNWESNQTLDTQEIKKIIPHFFKNSQDQAKFVVFKALETLAKSPEASIGIIVGTPSELSREIQALLQNYSIYHKDSLGTQGLFDLHMECFSAWIEWQKKAKLDVFQRFVLALRNTGDLSSLECKKVLKILYHAFCTVLTDDCEVLFQYIFKNSTCLITQDALTKWPLLSEEDTIHNHFKKSKESLKNLSKGLNFEKIQEFYNRIQDIDAHNCSKEAFLDWIYDIGTLYLEITPAIGNFDFSNVHLLTETLAQDIEFDYTFIVGLNKNLWPSTNHEDIFINKKQLNHFQKEIEVEGKQGIGHRAIPLNYSKILSSQDKKNLERARFIKILNNTRIEAIVTANFPDEKNTNPESFPSEFLTELLWAQELSYTEHTFSKNSSLSLDLFKIHSQLSQALIQTSNINNLRTYWTPEIAETKHAFQIRRDASRPFSGYEYSFEPSSVPNLLFPCKAWELFLKNPEQAWYFHILNVKPNPVYFNQNGLPLSCGNWVHEWLTLKHVDRNIVLDIHAKSLIDTLNMKAYALQRSVNQAYLNVHKLVPLWWTIHWQQTLSLAHRFLKKWLSVLEGYDWIIQEYELPENLNIQFPLSNKYALPTKGRIDAIAGQGETQENKEDALFHFQAAQKLLVIDFKTGTNTSTLTAKNLSRGKGLQGALYALGIQALQSSKNIEPSTIELTYISNKGQGIQTLEMKDIESLEPLWKGLQSMHERGVFGQLGYSQVGYLSGKTPRPLASTLIDPAIISQKWALSHPNLPAARELLKP